MRYMKNCLLIYFFLSFVPKLHSQNSTARFMLWQPSARSISLGGLGTAIVDNSFAVYYNPAGLAFSKGIDIVGSFVKPFSFFENTIHSLSAVSMSIKDYGTFAISANRFWRERQEITHNTPEIVGIDGEKFSFLKSTHWEAKLSYATLLNRNVSVGINISLLRIKLSNIGAGTELEGGKIYTAMFGGGLLIKNIFPKATLKLMHRHQSNFLMQHANNRDYQGISIGFAVLNVGSKIIFIDDAQKDNPPTLVSLGFAYWPVSSNIYSIMLSTDFEKQIFESSTLDYIHLGTEIRILHLFSVRTGYILDTSKPYTSYFSFGGGIHLKYFSINIARYKRSIVPTWHFDGTISVEI